MISPDAGWRALATGTLTIVSIDGEHDTILTEDVEGLARAVGRGWARGDSRCESI